MISNRWIFDLLYSGAYGKTKLFATYQPWFGQGNHHETKLPQFVPGFQSYDCTDPAYVSRLFDALQNQGIQGFCANWYGDYQTFVDKATFMAFEEAKKRGMWGSLQIDKLVFTQKKHKTWNNLQEMQYQLDFLKSKYFSHPAYHKIDDGRVMMLEFCETQVDQYWQQISDYNKSVAWMHENINGASEKGAAGIYCWTPTNAINGLNYFYQFAAKNPKLIPIGMICKGFNDRNPADPTKSIWNINSPVRYFPENSGQTWLDTIALVNKYFNPANPLPYLQVVTWNDHEEETGIEFGINNGVSLSPTFSNGVVSLNPQGNLNGVHHYEIDLIDPTGNSTTLNLDNKASIDLSGRIEIQAKLGQYSAKGRAVGHAGFLNKEANPITATEFLDWK